MSSWGHVEVGFPTQKAARSAELRQLGHGSATEPLAADIFKVPHHCSKNGLNLELVERINPTVSLISSAQGRQSTHHFPHEVAIEQLREALQPVAGSSKKPRKDDHEIGVYCTADTATDPIAGSSVALGSIAVVVPPAGHRLDVYRLGDAISDPIDAAEREARHSRALPDLAPIMISLLQHAALQLKSITWPNGETELIADVSRSSPLPITHSIRIGAYRTAARIAVPPG